MSKRRKAIPRGRQTPSQPLTSPAPASPAATRWRVWVRRSHVLLASITTVLALGLHLQLAKSAGPLWRDEIDTVNMASLPTWSDLLAHMPSAFPILWYVILRLHAFLGLATNTGFRTLGCCVGLLVVIAIWRNARRMNYHLPLLTLALVGLSPVVIRWGDSLRAYGLGLLLLLWVWGSVWHFINFPTRLGFIIVSAGSILAANCVYYDCVFLLAILGAGILVCLKNGHRQRALGLLAAGTLAALSMLPYAPALARGGDPGLVVADLGLKDLYAKFSNALNQSGPHYNWIWFGLIGSCVVSGLRAQALPKKFPQEKRNLALFGVLALLLSLVGFIAFLLRLGYATNSWYYLILMGVTAAAMEAVLAGLGQRLLVQTGQVAGLLILVAVAAPKALESVSQRQTNVDLVAAKLEEAASENDFILVSPWYMGMSFDRYYHGRAAWSTLPPLPDYKFHRFDLVREKLAAADQFSPIQPVLDQMGRALQSGQRVWIVGWLKSPGSEKTVASLPPASGEAPKRVQVRSEDAWLMHTEKFIEDHAPVCNPVKISSPRKIFPVENLPLYMVQGWKPTKPS